MFLGVFGAVEQHEQKLGTFCEKNKLNLAGTSNWCQTDDNQSSFENKSKIIS